MGYTSFELCMGYIPTAFPMTADYILDTMEEVKLFMEKNDTDRHAAEDAIKFTRSNQTEYKNRAHKLTPQYKAGDRVLLSTKNLNMKNIFEGAKKRFHKWVGPFEVLGQRDTTVENCLQRGRFTHVFTSSSSDSTTETSIVMTDRLRN